MKWRAYPKYKDSNIEWLKEIPEGWSVAPLKRGLARNDGGVWGEDFDDDGTIVLRSTEIALDGSWRIVEPARRRLTARERIDAHLEIGDLLVTKSSGSALHLGKTAVVTEDIAAMNCCYSNFTQRLRVNNRLHPRYLFWILNGPVGRDQLVFLGTTTTGLANLGAEIIGAVRIPFLPLPEQRAIAAFLDRKAGRLDVLIAGKERQIELLQDKRAALISHAVTRGLDPTAPMKDSGVEWLDRIPAHWRITHIKHLASSDYKSFIDGDWIESPYITDEGIRLIQTGNIGVQQYREQGYRYISEDTFDELVCTEVMPGDVLICRLAAPVGRACVAPNLGVRMITSVDVCILKSQSNHDPRYIVYFLSSEAYLHWMESLSRGSTRARISRSMLGDIEFVAPPFKEQRTIAAFLDHKTRHIDTLIKRVQNSIERLREYRTALISAAVTGKIDVRHEQVQRTSEVRCT